MIFFVQFSFELLVDPFILLRGGHEGEEPKDGEGSQKGKVGRPKCPEERSKHIIFVTHRESIYFISNYPIPNHSKGQENI